MSLSSPFESASVHTVADLVRAAPAAVRVLQQHGIDFCCGGKRPLADACAERGLATADVLAEVAAACHVPTIDWQSLTPAQLCAAIEARFHAPLPAELSRLLAMADRVLMVHGHKDPDRLEALRDTVAALQAELLPHLALEEEEVFAAIRAGATAQALQGIQTLEQEHEAVGALLKQSRALTDDFTPPPGACGTWRALYQGLGELEVETHEHIHVENNVLFPAIVQRVS